MSKNTHIAFLALALTGSAACGADLGSVPPGADDDATLAASSRIEPAETYQAAERDDHDTAVAGETGEVLKATFDTEPPCSSSQITEILAAEDLAEAYLIAIAGFEPSIILFGTPESRRLLDDRFAPRDDAEVQFIFDTYSLIRENLRDTEYACPAEDSADCEVPGTFARTNPASARTRLCPTLFDRSVEFQAGVLIHELSHQDRTSPNGEGTLDLNIASLRNAFSYEQYAPLCFEDRCLPLD